MMSDNVLNYTQARETVYGNPRLYTATAGAMLDAGIDERHKQCGTCERAAAQLYVNGWFDTLTIRCGGDTNKRVLKRAKKDARQQLIACGIIPSSFIWWALSWAFQAFLSSMIKRWLYNERD